VKKNILPILFSIFSFSFLCPITYTNKTFMSIPTPHSYLPMKYTTWHRALKQGSSAQNHWGTTIQVVPFYRTTTRSGKLGKYFGTNDKNVMTIDAFGPDTDLQNNLIIHQGSGASTNLKGKLKLDPKYTEYGALVALNQNLDHIHRGLFFRINIPIEHVEYDLRASVTDETKVTVEGSLKGVMDYFKGLWEQTTSDRVQTKLTHAKIKSLDSRSGVADVEVMLGAKLVERPDYEVAAAIKIIMPTGNRPSGEFLYQAIVGNNRHWGIGGEFDASMNIYKNEEHSLECILHIDYMYFFKSDEIRTLSYRNGADRVGGTEDTPIKFAWGHYILGGEQGKQGTFPLANILTREVDVTPGGKVNAHASFAYHRNNTTIDFGYSLLAKEGEKVTVKSWEDDKYGPAQPTYNTTSAFSVTNDAHVIGGAIQRDELILSDAATPAILKSSVHAAIGYTLSEWENPFLMGCGVSVDWTHDNSTPVGYTLWCKAGITF
jgi:hypothetical protein